MSDPASKTVFSYLIDGSYKIESVDANWREFARANGAEGLAEEAIGKSLFQFISGAEVRHIYQLLIDRVLSEQRTVRVPLRCDSPGLRREMELIIAPESGSRVRLSCQTMLETPHEVSLPVLDPDLARSDKFARMCSWCKRVHIDGEWKELVEAVYKLEWLAQPNPPQITHGICTECSKNMKELLKQAS